MIDLQPPGEIAADGLAPFPLSRHLAAPGGFPIPDWEAVHAWVATGQSAEQQAKAWAACEQAWLLHLRQALGPGYYVAESDTALLLSSLEPNVARATLDYMDRTLRRIAKLLDGIVQVPPWGKDILIMFDEAEGYYRYVSHYYPDEGGSFAYSGGMHIDAGCSHYVTVKADLGALEPVIAHEMTHGCLAHLPLPVWLNEGLAINTERRLAPRGCARKRLHQLWDKHFAFWGEERIQEFWSGRSFLRPDDGNHLSYDLARILVEELAGNWEAFRNFVLDADWSDAGAASAARHLGTDLGELVSGLLGQPNAAAWAPAPGKWQMARQA